MKLLHYELWNVWYMQTPIILWLVTTSYILIMVVAIIENDVDLLDFESN